MIKKLKKLKVIFSFSKFFFFSVTSILLFLLVESIIENEKKEYFDWNGYLKETNSVAAPETCFKNVRITIYSFSIKIQSFTFLKPFPKHTNNFQEGMLLEGIICVSYIHK
jgi:hypothetical protein